MAEQFSWFPLPCCSPPQCPFPVKSLALSAHVSPRTIHFRALNKSPLLGPGRSSPSCNKGAVLSCAAMLAQQVSAMPGFASTQILWHMQLLQRPAPAVQITSLAPGSSNAQWSAALSGRQLSPATLLESFIVECFWQDTTYAWLSLSPISQKADL